MGRVRILVSRRSQSDLCRLSKIAGTQYDVVGTVGDGRTLLKAAAQLKPDLVLVDVGMPLMNGLEAGKELKRLMPDIKLIFLTMNPDTDLAAEALGIGAAGYLLKTSQGSELLQAVGDAIRGIPYVTPQIRRAREEQFIRDPRAVNRPKYLTYRQREVLQMLAEGRSMKQIGDVLQIKFRTVRFHRSRIMEELGIATNSELVQYAIKRGMIALV